MASPSVAVKSKYGEPARNHCECEKSGNPITAPKRMRVTYTLTVDSNAVPAGELVRCWLPYPRTDQSRQQDVKFISASESKYTLSPQDCLHSTLYMENVQCKINQPYSLKVLSIQLMLNGII